MAKVRDYCSLITRGADLVKMATPIDQIIHIISQNTASRSVYVINENEKLVGVISVREVLNILGAKYLQKRTITLLHEILATTAADIMREVETVSPDDDLEQALKVSVVHSMDDIPVVENEKVVGNLDCFELIIGIEEQHRRESGEHHGAG